MTNKNEYFTLNNGQKIPKIGLGTFPMKGHVLFTAAKHAKKIGYEYYDTSKAYGNEKDVAKGLYGHFIKFIQNKNREKYIIQTKLFLDSCVNHKEAAGLRASLKKLKTSYVDVYLMHWADSETFIKNWQAMEKLYKDGLVKTIGVCNMEIHHLQAILDNCEIIPAINQVELTPLLTQKPLIEFCNKHNIHVQCYTPFARMDEKLFSNQSLIELSKKYNKKITQIILRWNIQQGRSVVPKSQTPERLEENFNIFDFELSDDDLKLIDNLNEDYRIRFHPDKYPIEWRQKNAQNV